MKIAKTVTGFNPELIGQFIKVVGVDGEGGTVDVRGFIKALSAERIIVSTVYTNYSNERADLYERDFYFSEFLDGPSEDGSFYELFIYTEAVPAEMEGGPGNE